MALNFTPDGQECNRLTTWNGATECYNPTIEQNLFRDIIAKLCSELGCGVTWDENGLQIQTPAAWEDFGYPGDVPDTYGTPVVCAADGLRTAAPSTSSTVSGASALELFGTFVGTGAPVVIPGSLLTGFLTFINPSVPRPMNFMFNVSAKLGIAPPTGALATDNAYCSLEYRLNGGAWTLAQAVYSDNTYIPGTHKDGTHQFSGNGSVFQIAGAGSAVIDLRGVYYGVSGRTYGFEFGLPSVVGMGASA